MRKVFLAIIHTPRCIIVNTNDECIRVKWWHDQQFNLWGICCQCCLHNDALFWFKSPPLIEMFAFCDKKIWLLLKNESFESIQGNVNIFWLCTSNKEESSRTMQQKNDSAMWGLGKSCILTLLLPLDINKEVQRLNSVSFLLESYSYS